MPEVHHEDVYYTGRVQGVGFRYQTLQVARGFEVSGYVRNLMDGRVHLEVEGARSEVDAFVEAIAEHMQGYIRETARQPSRRSATLQGFGIR